MVQHKVEGTPTTGFLIQFASFGRQQLEHHHMHQIYDPLLSRTIWSFQGCIKSVFETFQHRRHKNLVGL